MAVAKEPWEMTQKEYVADLSETFEPVVFGTQVGSKVRWRGTGEKAIAKQKADILRGAPEAHRYKVRQALKEGKSVSTEVLKDYPELGSESYAELLLNRTGAGVDNPEDIARFPPVAQLNDTDLWKLVLTPAKHATPKVKEYFEQAEKEFARRGVKLEPMVSAKPSSYPSQPERRRKSHKRSGYSVGIKGIR